MSIKATEHSFRLVFNGGTSVDNIDKHDIPKPSFNFKEFDEIKKGILRPNVQIGKLDYFFLCSLYKCECTYFINIYYVFDRCHWSLS